MAKQYSRQEVLDRLKKTNSEGKPVIIAGAGTGISGKFAEQGFRRYLQQFIICDEFKALFQTHLSWRGKFDRDVCS